MIPDSGLLFFGPPCTCDHSAVLCWKCICTFTQIATYQI